MNLYNKIDLINYNNKKRINLNCIIIIFYIISFLTSISCILILILYEYITKWIGSLFILIELFLLVISIVIINNIKQKQNIQSPSNVLIIIILFHFLCLFVISIYITINFLSYIFPVRNILRYKFNKISIDLKPSFISFCFVWCIFHFLLISDLRYYIINKKILKQKIDFNKITNK